MKKILFILIACFCITYANAQINVIDESSARGSDYIVKNMYSNIRCDNGTYFLNSKDIRSGQNITLRLGNKEETIVSLKYLNNWISTSKNKSFIVIEIDNIKYTIYKQNGTNLVISDGDVEYIKTKMRNMILDSTVGGGWDRNRHSDPLLGYIMVNHIYKALEIMNEMN